MKQIILPLSLLLSFVTVKTSDILAVDVAPAAQTTPAIDPSQAAQPTPAVDPSQVAPVVPVASASQPAPTATVPSIPTETDINNLLGLVTAYQHQADVLKSLHDLASSDAPTPNLPNEDSVRSLLNLLELHKKEADLITSLRASLASIQASLGQWDADVASLSTKQKKTAAKQKIAKRSIDFGAVKEINKPRGNN